MLFEGLLHVGQVWLLLMLAGAVGLQRFPKPWSRASIFRLQSNRRPITFRSIEIPISKRKDPVEVFVDERNMDVYFELQSLIDSGKKANPDALEELARKGAAFPLSDANSIELYEEAVRQQALLASVPKIFKKPKNPFSNIETFVNVGTHEKPFFVKSYLKKSFNVSEDHLRDVKEVERNLQGFGNLTRLFEVERRLNKAADIPEKLDQMGYSWFSPQWEKYLQHVIAAEQVTISHAIIEYYRNSPAEVVGHGKFRRKAGFLGTMAPPEDETLATGAYMLPKRILHPWPAVTESPLYVRWAPSHPRIPSILVMMARNGQFEESLVVRENEDAITPGTPDDPIYAGQMMEARDVARLARFATEGRSYDPAIQIPHPGLRSDEHGSLPFYNAAHGPTMDVLDTLPERDEAFWADVLPSYDTSVLLEQHLSKRPISDEAALEVNEEEVERAKRAAALVGSFEGAPWRQEEQRLEAILERNVQGKLAAMEEQLRDRLWPSDHDGDHDGSMAQQQQQRRRRVALYRSLRSHVAAQHEEWMRLTDTLRPRLLRANENTLLCVVDAWANRPNDIESVSTTKSNSRHTGDGEADKDGEAEEEAEEEDDSTSGRAARSVTSAARSRAASGIEMDALNRVVLNEQPLLTIFADEYRTVSQREPITVEAFVPAEIAVDVWQRLKELSVARDQLRQLLTAELLQRIPAESFIEQYPVGSPERDLAAQLAWSSTHDGGNGSGSGSGSEWIRLLQALFPANGSRIIDWVPETLLSTAEQRSADVSLLSPPTPRQGPHGASSWTYSSPTTTKGTSGNAEAVAAVVDVPHLPNPLASYQTNAALQFELQHGPLSCLLPPEHNPLARAKVQDQEDISWWQQECRRMQREVFVPHGDLYIRTVQRSRQESARRVLDDFRTEMATIDEDDDNLACYYHLIRRCVRRALRRRFPGLYGRGYETFMESLGMETTRIPGSSSPTSEKALVSKDQREIWQKEVDTFLHQSLEPVANRVLLRKFVAATAAGYKSFSENPPTLDVSEIAMPVLSLEPSEEASIILTNPNIERDAVRQKREEIMANELRMRQYIDAAEGRTRGPKDQVDFAVAVSSQLQRSVRRVKAERKVLMAYKVGGGDDGATRGRKSGKTRLPAAPVPPPKEPGAGSSMFDADGLLDNTAKLVSDHKAGLFPFHVEE